MRLASTGDHRRAVPDVTTRECYSANDGQARLGSSDQVVEILEILDLGDLLDGLTNCAHGAVRKGRPPAARTDPTAARSRDCARNGMLRHMTQRSGGAR
eukprot:2270147-Pleurochrysis_carterae.AAC.3